MTTPAEQKFMIDCIVTDLSLFLMRDHGMTEEQSLSTIYKSDFFSRLNNIESGLFAESSNYNYHLLQLEVFK